MTENELNEIEARANKTTSGKWVFYYSSESTLNNDDMDFLAHCRKDVPALIAEVRQLKAERDALLDEFNKTESYPCETYDECKYLDDYVDCRKEETPPAKNCWLEWARKSVLNGSI